MVNAILGFSVLAAVALTWDRNTEPDLAGYNCKYRERGTRGFTTYSTIRGNNPYCTVTGLDQSKIYVFAVTAFNNNTTIGTIESGLSNRVIPGAPRSRNSGVIR